jgi:hypothetical protein
MIAKRASHNYAEALVHEAPCWGELNPRPAGTTGAGLRIPVP